MKLDLNAIALFNAVAEHGGFSAAARQLDMPVSTVSRKVAELEAALGVQLLVRSTRAVRLTELGQQYHERCARSLHLLEDASSELSESSGRISGRLRVTAPPTLHQFLIPVFGEFQALHRGVSIDVHLSPRRISAVRDNVDVLFRIGPIGDESLIARALIQYRNVVCASPLYLRAAGPLQHPQDLAQHRCLAWASRGKVMPWSFVGSVESHTITPPATLSGNDYAMLQAAAEAGQGVTELPPVVGGQSLFAGKLKRVLPTWQLPLRTMYLLYPAHLRPSPLVRRFRDHCVERLPSLAQAYLHLGDG